MRKIYKGDQNPARLIVNSRVQAFDFKGQNHYSLTETEMSHEKAKLKWKLY